jgi:hypothetical protein
MRPLLLSLRIGNERSPMGLGLGILGSVSGWPSGMGGSMPGR